VKLVCLDLEGVLVPEVWIGVAETFGIDSLRATTRDIPDYDVLMRQRLRILADHGLKLADIQAVIGTMRPLEGAVQFLSRLRAQWPVLILSDTFYDFAAPLMQQLGWPTLFCHQLEVDEAGFIIGYRLRMRDHKRAAVAAFRELQFQVTAVGDSYNDISMLSSAHAGILFRAPDNVIAEFPQFAVVRDYGALSDAIEAVGDPQPSQVAAASSLASGMTG
jgi:phosphoserine / homoserine phosphotransferase